MFTAIPGRPVRRIFSNANRGARAAGDIPINSDNGERRTRAKLAQNGSNVGAERIARDAAQRQRAADRALRAVPGRFRARPTARRAGDAGRRCSVDPHRGFRATGRRPDRPAPQPDTDHGRGTAHAHGHAPRSAGSEPPPLSLSFRSLRATMFFLSLLQLLSRRAPLLNRFSSASKDSTPRFVTDSSKIRPPFHAPPRGVYGVATSSLLTNQYHCCIAWRSPSTSRRRYSSCSCSRDRRGRLHS